MFAAMGAEPRLQIMRLLLKAHPEGLVVGELQAELGAAASTLSHHLEKLRHEELVGVDREGTFLRYRANTDTLRELLGVPLHRVLRRHGRDAARAPSCASSASLVDPNRSEGRSPCRTRSRTKSSAATASTPHRHRGTRGGCCGGVGEASAAACCDPVTLEPLRRRPGVGASRTRRCWRSLGCGNPTALAALGARRDRARPRAPAAASTCCCRPGASARRARPTAST